MLTAATCGASRPKQSQNMTCTYFVHHFIQIIWVIDRVALSQVNATPIGAIMMQSDVLSGSRGGRRAHFRNPLHRENFPREIRANAYD